MARRATARGRPAPRSTRSPPNFTDSEFWASRDMDRIVTVISDGAAAVGGSSLMVGWSASFSAEQIQQLADYVASFRPDAQ
jgi:hypothetical protein